MEDTAKQEILEAIGLLAETIQVVSDTLGVKVTSLDTKVASLDTKVTSLDTKITSLDSRVSSLASNVAYLKTQSVTKNYLDDKLADLRADLIVMARKTNTKISLLIEGLVKEGSLRRDIADQLLGMEPFARV